MLSYQDTGVETVKETGLYRGNTTRLFLQNQLGAHHVRGTSCRETRAIRKHLHGQREHGRYNRHTSECVSIEQDSEQYSREEKQYPVWPLALFVDLLELHACVELPASKIRSRGVDIRFLFALHPDAFPRPIL